MACIRIARTNEEDKYRLTRTPPQPIIGSCARESKKNLTVYGAAVDETFLTEMSNLSPPIIYPPPSARSRPAGSPAGRFFWRPG